MTRTILTSPEFLAPEAYRAKVKTPFEFVVSAAAGDRRRRADALPLVRQLQQLGMPLYQCQPPTGYEDTADAWVNTGALVSRMNFALTLAGNKLRSVTLARRRRQTQCSPAICRRRRARRSQGDRCATDGGADARFARNSNDGELVMLSRRVFLKNGAFAFVSLGFAPSFLSRTAHRRRPDARSSSSRSFSAARWTV